MLASLNILLLFGIGYGAIQDVHSQEFFFQYEVGLRVSVGRLPKRSARKSRLSMSVSRTCGSI